MSPNQSATPSAWDDDWENLADKQDSAPDPPSAPEPRLSRTERKVRHQEANRQLWEEASKPAETPIFIQARSPNPPLISAPVKTAVKVLARKPPPANKPISNSSKSTPAQPVDDEPDSDEEERQRAASQFAERQAQAAKEREEKQRKYAQVRERLFGREGAPQASGSSAPSGLGNRPPSSGTPSGRGAGRGRAPNRSGNSSPAKNTRTNNQLYDPEYTPKPGSIFIQRREAGTPPQNHEEKPIREPRGPDGSGRGFAIRLRGGAGREV